MKTLFLGFVFVALVFAPPVDAAKKATTRLQVIVLDDDGEPVPRASVIVRTLKGKKNKVTDTLQLKTSEKGTAPLPPIRQGSILLQVHARGYQTYGETLELTEAEQIVNVTLLTPQDQVTITR